MIFTSVLAILLATLYLTIGVILGTAAAIVVATVTLRDPVRYQALAVVIVFVVTVVLWPVAIGVMLWPIRKE